MASVVGSNAYGRGASYWFGSLGQGSESDAGQVDIGCDTKTTNINGQSCQEFND